jgi:hypothetical protein
MALTEQVAAWKRSLAPKNARSITSSVDRLLAE